jgi:hypothetical protein
VTRKKGAWFLFHSEHSTGCAAVNQLTEAAARSSLQVATAKKKKKGNHSGQNEPSR